MISPDRYAETAAQIRKELTRTTGALKPARTTTVTTHHYEIEGQPEWPDLPWPSWKPGTTKVMRPYLIKWSVTIRDDEKPHRDKVVVYGHRVNAGGLGAVVDCDYYYSEKMPAFVREIVKLSE